MRKDSYEVIVVGGGFFGIALALEARKYARDVLLVECEDALMLRASYSNQARVHHGYHYPRSLLTAERSRASFTRFVETYRDCIVDDFTKIYAIARNNSKVSAAQFARFCERVGAPFEEAASDIQAHFNRHTVERAFKVREYAFDSIKLCALLEQQLEAAEVDVARGTEARRVLTGKLLRVELAERDEPVRLVGADWVFNATYANLNRLLVRSELEQVPLKHELAEIALVRPPAPLDTLGITLMDGPFFSCMPFPCANAHSLTHVRYTPQATWTDADARGEQAPRLHDLTANQRPSAVEHMLRDAARYVPALTDAAHVGSLWEVKSLLPQSERDDSRPILFQPNAREPRVVSTLGAKIDNVIDLAEHVQRLLFRRQRTASTVRMNA